MIIYVLKLQHGKYYVGKTANFEKRINQHNTGIGGSFWTKLHRPIEVIRKFEIKCKSNNQDYIYGLEEDKIVKEMMCLHGIENVRGGSYVQEIIDPEIKESLRREIRFAKDLCISCGSNKHFISDCDRIVTYQCDICKKEFAKRIECEYHVKHCNDKIDPEIDPEIDPDPELELEKDKNKLCCCIIC